MALDQYKIFSKSKSEYFHYQSFVGEPLCVQLLNEVEKKLKIYFNHSEMTLENFRNICQQKYSKINTSLPFLQLGLFNHRDPDRVLYQLGINLDNNHVLKKLDHYLQDQIRQKSAEKILSSDFHY